MNDHQRLSAYTQGDEQAFEALVEKYFNMVYTVAARRTGDWHLAEEIAQSVFILLSRKARGFSPKTPLPGWLLRTTCFVCRDAIKMRRRRSENERKLAENLDQHVSTNEPSAMELHLEEAMQALRPEEQAGIVAHFFEGKDFPEIAETFMISEHAARKRNSRCLAKLQSLMSKRGAKVALPALTGLLATLSARATASHAVPSALQAANAAWKGAPSADNVLILADRATRWMRWRFWLGTCLKVGCVGLLLLLLTLSYRSLNPPVSARLERLGRAWGTLDHLVAQHTRFLIQTPPTAPNSQARVQADLETISRDSSRIITALSPLLAPPDERTRLAQFLTAELGQTLSLNAATRSLLFSYISSHQSRGATVKDAMKSLAQETQAEAVEIKTMLSEDQQRIFDQEYGPDGARLFSYAKVVALGSVGQ
jgi:RNA polymerase sigma-70 factor (ECF subfamily)